MICLECGARMDYAYYVDAHLHCWVCPDGCFASTWEGPRWTRACGGVPGRMFVTEAKHPALSLPNRSARGCQIAKVFLEAQRSRLLAAQPRAA